jgi:hypothetical protein
VVVVGPTTVDVVVPGGYPVCAPVSGAIKNAATHDMAATAVAKRRANRLIARVLSL